MTAREVIRFPRPMKRGAKVRRGPCAQMLHFPAPLSGADLFAEWQWLDDNHRGWRHEKLLEPDDLADFDQSKFDRRRESRSHVRVALGREPLTENEMRRDIVKWRARIERRVQMKDWLETLGVNWKAVRDADGALFFVFDRLA